MADKYIPLEELDIYQQAMEIGEEVWQMVSHWRYFERDTLGKQVVRSVDSIAANIAEGYGRYHFGDRKTFSYYARGSLLETKTWLEKALQRDLIERTRYDAILLKLKDLHFKLNIYIKKLRENR
jgi:four helix bundle protein